MNIALRVLVILILIMNGVALWFAIELFGKRELLQERTKVLQDNIVTLARTFEAVEPTAPEVTPDLNEKDIDTVTEMMVETPTMSTFWDSYKFEYEVIGTPTMDISGRRRELRELYELDAQGKPVMDGGEKSTNGRMKKLLDEVKDRATAQLALLNNIRAELKKVRDELNDTNNELNNVKQEGRKDKATIVELRAQINQLNATIADLNGRISALNSTISSLENEKAEIAAERDKIAEEKDELDILVAELNARIEEMLRIGGGGKGAMLINLTAGVKGSVVAADNKLKFAIIQVTDAAMAEFVGTPEEPRELPQTELLVRHSTAREDDVVTKIRMRMLGAGNNLIICDILGDFQQGAVQVGDVVFYL